MATVLAAIGSSAFTSPFTRMTAQGLGTTDARKLFTRLPKKGYLHPADDTRGHVVL
ncbi:hypothetical protein [Tardiphaga sp. OK246]|uniref:hypothetical protein n=1 Tax=Tardiphaga sp. OK246 TaxID=1855307 RepID=UPI0015960BAF|nr:hypothetical protein [Tardiphaga sp. OK246]